jgi:hypothetical protein
MWINAGTTSEDAEIRADQPLATPDLRCKSLCITVGRRHLLTLEFGCEFPPVTFGHSPFRP